MKTAGLGLAIALACTVHASGDTAAPSDLTGTTVAYAHIGKVKLFPAPSLVFERGGLVSDKERNRLHDALLIPVIRSSTKPVAVVVLELFTPDTSEVELTVYWSDGTWAAMNLKTPDGRPVDFATYQAALQDLEESSKCDD